jgi:hypothetical protein
MLLRISRGGYPSGKSVVDSRAFTVAMEALRHPESVA